MSDEEAVLKAAKIIHQNYEPAYPSNGGVQVPFDPAIHHWALGTARAVLAATGTNESPAGLALPGNRVHTAGGAVLSVHAAPEHLGDGIVLTGQLERPSDDRHFWVYLDPKAWAEFALIIGQPHKATVLAIIAKLRPKQRVWRGADEDWETQGYHKALDDVEAAL